MINNNEFVQRRVVYNIDVSKIKELCLKGEVPELSGLAIPLCNEKEREILGKNNEIARKVKEQVDALWKDEKFITYMKACEEAEEKREKLFDSWALDTAKNMLKKDIDVSMIADFTGLDIEEVEALK